MQFNETTRDVVAETINRRITVARITKGLDEDTVRLFEGIAQDFSDTFEMDDHTFNSDEFWSKCGLNALVEG